METKLKSLIFFIIGVTIFFAFTSSVKGGCSLGGSSGNCKATCLECGLLKPAVVSSGIVCLIEKADPCYYRPFSCTAQTYPCWKYGQLNGWPAGGRTEGNACDRYSGNCDNIFSGKWDPSENACVTCSGKLQTYADFCGSSSSVQKCEKTCGASAECDEVAALPGCTGKFQCDSSSSDSSFMTPGMRRETADITTIAATSPSVKT